MRKIVYSRTVQVAQYEPLVVTAEIERHKTEPLEHFIARSLKEFAMLLQNSKVLRK